MKKVDTTNWRRADFIRFYTEVWGVPVIPIQPNKVPALKEWRPYQTRMPTREELDGWFVKRNPWGVAIICQQGLFSPDMDSQELYDSLFKSGAFPPGASVYQSARGYHAILRAKSPLPYAVKEHNALLAATDPLLFEFGVSGHNGLAIVPDTPERTWLELYDEPCIVDYDEWLRKYVGYTKELEDILRVEIPMKCPYHHDEHASLFINPQKGVFQCFGCHAKGKVEQLLIDSTQMGFELPDKIKSLINAYLSLPTLKLSDTAQDETIDVIIDQLLEGGENGTAIISGTSGVGKTTLGLSIAIPLCRGEKVLGKLWVPTPKRVTMLSFEVSGKSLLRQAQRMTQTLGGTDNLTFLDASTVRSEDEDSINKLVRSVAMKSAEVVIMDTIQAFVRDYNSQEEATVFWKMIMRIRDELNCAVICLHHTATGEMAGTGAERAKGAIGKLVATYSATKLLYADIEGEMYYGRLSGMTRAWGRVDWCVAYEDITGTANIIDWRDLDRDARQGLGRPLIVSMLDQALILARRMGKTKTECADEIGVDRKSINRYLAGERYPDGEGEDKIRAWIEKVKAAAKVVAQS
jgi:KaiC/GvpD/RAD55 family RecA-like ATPase